jgi:hypothetical protein
MSELPHTHTQATAKTPNKIGLGFMYIQLDNRVGGKSVQRWNRPALETLHLDGVLCLTLEILLAIDGVERIGLQMEQKSCSLSPPMHVLPTRMRANTQVK